MAIQVIRSLSGTYPIIRMLLLEMKWRWAMWQDQKGSTFSVLLYIPDGVSLCSFGFDEWLRLFGLRKVALVTDEKSGH